jgi:TonB family protein
LRVVGLLPDWTPGEQDGKKVAVYRIIPILFQQVSPEDAWQVTEKTVVVIDKVRMPDSFNPSVLNFDKFATVNVLKPFPEKEKSRLKSKYGKQAENGVILVTTNKNEIQYSLPDSTLASLKSQAAECKEEAVLPAFPGGEVKMLGYIADSIQYPFVAKRTKTEGKVFVRFMVDTAGKVSNATVARSVDYFLNKEAIRVISSMPAWTPGALCDKKINFYVTVPVIFKLDLPKVEKKEWERTDKTIVLLDGVRLPVSFQLEWLKYENLASYKVLQPTTKEITKQLQHQYGHDAAYGVILIESRK